MGFKERLSSSSAGSLGPLLYGLVVTYVLVVIFSLVLSLIFHFTPLNESWMHPLGIATATLSLFFGGRTAARITGARGLFHGLSLGLLFIILTILVSSTQEIAWSAAAIKSIYALLAAVIGGVSGVK